MDDDLLADDGQFKDDGLDELDIDEEAALLGLSDEEIESERLTANKDLEYVDEDGNPVEIGENNAGLYEVAKYHSNKNRGTPTEDDVLDLDLDAELESFTEENPDLLRESPAKSFNDRQCTDNLIPLTSRNKPTAKRPEPRYSPDRNVSRVKTESSFSGLSSRKVSMENLNIKLEYDEESEDEDDDDRRERFKSERSNIITLTPAKNRNIPDTLESVINEEETAKVQAFLENEQKRKQGQKRYKGRDSYRMKGLMRQNRPTQSFPSVQHQPPQFSSPAPPPQQPYQHGPPQGSSQPRKILINPHFRGVRQPPPTETAMIPNQNQQVTAPPVSYNTPQIFAPPVGYSQDHSHQVNIAPPPTFSAPPPAMQYNHPEYPPPQQPIHIQQAPPPVWQTPPPEMHPPPVSYANPPPPLNYGDHMSHNPPGYHNNYSSNNYQNPAYSSPQIPPPQMAPPLNMNYNQPPPTVHMHTTSHAPGAFTPSTQSINVPQMHFKTTPPVQRQQQKSYQDQRNVNQTSSHNFQRNTNHQNQNFNRVPEKRPSNVAPKQVPKKQLRIDHQPRKNLHVNSSNIREIPLVDTIKKEPLVVPIKKEACVPAVEEEDEKTKELRKKIEEQKLLREQILKRKEERRRQMASQRLMDLQKRQMEQNKTANVVIVPRVEQKTPIQAPIKTNIKAKISVKERIGVPLSNTGQAVKKKIVVVRKKAVPPLNNAVPTQQQKVVGMAQRFGNQPLKQQQQPPPQKLQPQKKTLITAPTSQTTQVKAAQQVAKVVPKTDPPKQPITLKKTNPPNKTLAKVAAKKILAKSKPYTKVTNMTQQRQKGNILQRLGNKGNFNARSNFRPQHQQGLRLPQSGRFNGPRPPFMEHRMRFPGPINDMRPPFQDQRPPPFEQRPPPFDQRSPIFEQRPPPFEQRPPHFEQRPPLFEDCPPPFHDQRPPPFENQRPPLLPFHPHGERPPFNQFMFEPDRPRFPMQGPGFDDFHHMRMDRFPRPQFPNQMMRPQFEPNNGPMFQRPQFSASHPRQNNQQKKTVIKSSPVKTSPAKAAVTIKKEKPDDSVVSAQNLNQQKPSNSPVDSKHFSVCVENLSSSTSEMQLKKLCSSVGVVENIRLIKTDRKAVIKFKEPAHALNFQKKFQRYMLDLAMIQVTLTST